MKLNGVKITGPNEETIIIPRGDTQLVFKAQAVLDMEPFNSMVQAPKPGMRMLPGGKQEFNPDDKFYVEEMKQYAEKRYSYIMIKSLEATPGLEWETVKFTDPSTWMNYENELKESGFNFAEIRIVQEGVLAANALNENKLEEARARFLALEELRRAEQSSQTAGQ